MAHTTALPSSPPLTSRNKKRRIQWDMGDYGDAMVSDETCVPMFSASDSQRMMSCENPPFPGGLEFDETILNNQLQLQNDLPGFLPLASNESPYGVMATDIPYPGGMNAPVAPGVNIPSNQDLRQLDQLTEEFPLTSPSTRRQMGLYFSRPRRTPGQQSDLNLNLNNQDNQIKQFKRRKSHNIVERRYRVNLNGKFRQLEQVVLQGTTSPCDSSPCSSQQTPSPRPPSSPQKARSKARILDGALNYIASLENEINSLKERTEGSKGGLAEGRICVEGPEVKF
ncbi:hypothetical protein ASPVEDRAFT_46909 [Aspergillus versicolor CBS 583.65]|uniref:BHLH domain-containing protein n=1 Tax=Aspergillus versicolor CBS 583.65 TaxID=1036611 RepID=A0A1L9Q1K2_ASPVE|nr:uncharacterized protein ASPVEDRAFT_46909 [Aspergillus versicolor CBS 583.65]OJJ07657.1 hypothetical protein ASPVEDRAFT_46909 [Aspergillus versicolor CBS 583.65]